MPTILDTAGSSNTYATNEKPVDMYPRLTEDYQRLTPLTVISTKLGARDVQNTRIDWTEDADIPTTVSISAADGSTTLTIANYTYLREGDILFCPRSKERIRVSATPTTASVTVVRGIGDSSEATLYTYDVLHIISPAVVENEDASYPRSTVATNFYNYTQIVNHFIRTTKSTLNEKTYFGPIRERNQAKMWREYRIKAEKTLLFGDRASTAGPTTGDLNFRTMGGMVYRLASGTNVKEVPSILTETMFSNWLVDVWTQRCDSENLVLFAAPKVITTITNMAKPLIQASPNVKEWGLPWLKSFSGGPVNVDLVPLPILSTETVKGWGFLVDMDYVSLAFLRRPRLLKNVYLERAEFIEDKIESEISFILRDEARHGFIYGITG